MVGSTSQHDVICNNLRGELGSQRDDPVRLGARELLEGLAGSFSLPALDVTVPLAPGVAMIG